jgi:hypothetical protein
MQPPLAVAVAVGVGVGVAVAVAVGVGVGVDVVVVVLDDPLPSPQAATIPAMLAPANHLSARRRATRASIAFKSSARLWP